EAGVSCRVDYFFRQLGKVTAKPARENPKRYWIEIATSMEQAWDVDDTRNLGHIIHAFFGRHSSLINPICDVNGGFIADNSAKVERWPDHFDTKLNTLLSSTAYLFSLFLT
ncbi:unnamed protein product, partial [Dibothriocephalus latus]